MGSIRTKQELLDAARERGILLAPDSASIDLTGTDFIVLQGSDEKGTPWIVRSPRREDVLARAAQEHRVLALLGPRLPVRVPTWQEFTPELIAYQRLSGEPAAVVDLAAGGYVWRFDEAHPPARFVRSLARTLAALHGIEEDAVATTGVRIARPEALRLDWAERFRQSREILAVSDAVWHRWQRWLADDSYWPEHSVLVHGDLHPAHILIDEQHECIGLLDWTEAHLGDPATDFNLLFATLGSQALGELLRLYGEAGGRVWPRMHSHIAEMWAAYPAVVAKFFLTSGEPSHRELAQYLLDAVAAESADGTGAAPL